MSRARNTVPLNLSREWFDYLLIALALVMFLNLVLAVVFLDSNQEGYLHLRKEGFRMVACWVLLLSVCLSSAHLRNYRLAVLVLCTGLGAGVQFLSQYSAQAQGAQYSRFELIMSVFSVYFTLPMFIVLLTSTKVDNLMGQLEKEKLRLQRANAEGGRTIELLKKSKEQNEEKPEEDDESNLSRRRYLQGLTSDFYKKLVKVRFRRDVNNLLEELFSQGLGFPQGFVLEAPDEGREMKVKNVWGFQAPGPELDKQIGEFKDRDLTAWAFERREILDQESFRKLPNLFEAADRFNGQLFPLAYVIPVVSMGRTANIVYLAAQKPSYIAPFDYPTVEPFLTALGLVLAKVGGKSAKPQFAVFGG